MSTIRERDAAWTGRPNRDRPGWHSSDSWQVTAADRRALLRALDDLTTKVQVQHPTVPVVGFGDVVLDVWCEGCDDEERECWGRDAIAIAREVTG